MLKRYKYDVAFSVAEEDLKIAEKIAESFRQSNITYYLYSEQPPENWGKALIKISMDIYTKESNFVLFISSETSSNKHWLRNEREMIDAFMRNNKDRTLRLVLDEAPASRLDTAFLKWQNNPDEIANKVKYKLDAKRKKEKKNWAWLFTLFIILTAALYMTSRFISTEPDYSSYLASLNQGDSLIQQNKFTEARKAYKRALEYNPKDEAASKKLLLLDSADQLIKQHKNSAAQNLFHLVLTIPASPVLTPTALEKAGVTSNPPINILIQWNGNSLTIKISGGVPFNNEKQPYLIMGISCQDCIQWTKKDSNYIAQVDGKDVNVKKIQLKDRVGQFLYKEVPANFSIQKVQTNLPDNSHAEPDKPVVSQKETYLAHMTTGDSLFDKELYDDARSEYLAAKNILPGDAMVAKKISVCDEKIRAAAEKKAKDIPKLSIPAGSFTMGTENGNPDDGPEHKVTINSFYMSKTEVTVAQYKNFCLFTGREMPAPPPYGWIDDYPIVNITWNEAAAYCQWVGGSLPTEAQWEYAANANSNLTYSGSNQIGNVAWYSANSGGRPGRAASKSANAFGLRDMTGNVLEWCQDWYGRKYYAAGEADNPKGPNAGDEKVVRGGAYNSFINSTQDGNQLRITYRNSEAPSSRKPYIGFRVVWNN